MLDFPFDHDAVTASPHVYCRAVDNVQRNRTEDAAGIFNQQNQENLTVWHCKASIPLDRHAALTTFIPLFSPEVVQWYSHPSLWYMRMTDFASFEHLHLSEKLQWPGPREDYVFVTRAFGQFFLPKQFRPTPRHSLLIYWHDISRSDLSTCFNKNHIDTLHKLPKWKTICSLNTDFFPMTKGSRYVGLQIILAWRCYL